LWSVGRGQLLLSDDELGELTPLLFANLLDAWESIQRRRESATGMLATVMANSLAPKKSGRWKLGDFLPWAMESSRPREQTVDEQRKMVRMLRQLFGDKRDRAKRQEGESNGTRS
jgi:hypothetical protein